MYNKILNEIANKNININYQVVKYDSENKFFIGLNNHYLICEKVEDFESTEDKYFNFYCEEINYDSVFPNYNVLLKKDYDEIEFESDSKLKTYKLKKGIKNLSKKVIKIDCDYLNLDFIKDVVSVLGSNGKLYKDERRQYKYVTDKGIAIVCALNKFDVNQYLETNDVKLSDLIKKQKALVSIFVVMKDGNAMRCFKNIKDAQSYCFEISGNIVETLLY